MPRIVGHKLGIIRIRAWGTRAVVMMTAWIVFRSLWLFTPFGGRIFAHKLYMVYAWIFIYKTENTASEVPPPALAQEINLLPRDVSSTHWLAPFSDLLTSPILTHSLTYPSSPPLIPIFGAKSHCWDWPSCQGMLQDCACNGLQQSTLTVPLMQSIPSVLTHKECMVHGAESN